MSDTSVQNFKDLYRKHSSDDNTAQLGWLWHYTTADGLMGIIKDDPNEHKKLHFWFTRSDCLNDPSEGKHILELFGQVSTELLSKNLISHSFYEAIKDAKIPNTQFINFPIPPREEYVHESVLDVAPCHAYICSFSLKEDSLDMWRYYSNGNGGYGIKCFSTLFDKIKEYEHSDYDEDATFCSIQSYKVIYDNGEKRQIIESIITDTFSAYTNANEEEQNKRQSAKGFIQYALKTFQFRFKHECYSSEQEYRFVVYIPYSKPQLLKNELPPILFRKQNGAPIPYIDLVVDNGDAYLDEIMISPFIENESVLATTSDYLSQCGFNCTVRVSQLPVRR